MANVTPHGPSLFALSEPSEDVESIHFVSMVALSQQVSLPPRVEELGLDFLVDVEPHKILVFVVFMNEIHSMSIPFS